MKLKIRITSWYKPLSIKVKEFVNGRYIKVRKSFLVQWTKISEKNRETFFSFISVTLNFLLNALIISVPVTLLLHLPYWKAVICVWFMLPFIEHYYIWFREDWKDAPVK